MYKDSLMSYRKIEDKTKGVKAKSRKRLALYNILLYISAFLSARVVIMDNFMPFGIALLITCLIALSSEVAFMVGVFSALGYFSSFNGNISLAHFLVCITLLVLSVLGATKGKVLKTILIGFFTNLIVNSLVYYKTTPSEDVIIFSFLIILLESILILASSYMFLFGVPSFFQKNRRKVYTREEKISLNILVAIAITGIWQPSSTLELFSLRNVIALIIIIYTGFLEGATIGSATGVVYGIIAGLSYMDNPSLIGLFGLCGLMAGVFKDLGKLVSGAAALISGALIALYLNGGTSFNNIAYDVLIGVMIFLLVPRDRIVSGFIIEEEKIKNQQIYADRLRDIITNKLVGVSSTLKGFSEVLEKNLINERAKKVEIDGMVESLANKVCNRCEYRPRCWNKDFYFTYNQFVEVLRLIERNGRIDANEIPMELDKKCIRPNELTRVANSIFEIFRLNNEWKKRLLNSRVIVSEQIKGISSLVNSMMEEVAATVEFRSDIEEEIAAALEKHELDYKDVLSIKNNRGMHEITVYKKPCYGKQACSKKYGEIIGNVLNIRMTRDNDTCRFNSQNTLCQFRFVEVVNYQMVSAAATASKSSVSGDSYSFGDIGEGRHLVALSDGMGIGHNAHMESETTVSMLEKFLSVGFDRATAIKAINSVLVLRSCEESYATIDMALFDLYTGVGEFLKIGSAPTFIKSGKSIKTIKSATLPVGILEEVDMESEIIQMKNGDIIVMASDGVVDSDNELKEKWIEKALLEFDNGNPREIADYILERAKMNYGHEVKDDMTVVVSKIWKVI